MFCKPYLTLLLSLSILITGCSTVLSGKYDNISVSTEEITNSECELSNSLGSWIIKTPGMARVHRSDSPLKIKCRKAGLSGQHTIPAEFNVITLLNVLFWPGLLVDALSDTTHKYSETSVIVPLRGKS